MATLIAHLRRSEEHGRLPFHPDCPVCRAERLSGALPAQGPVGRRTQAAVVAAILAASTAAPTVAAAQEADQVTEGAIAPDGPGTDSAESPEFDPGGATEDLPYDAPDGVDPAPASEQGPLEPEPVTDGDVPVADAGDEAAPAPTVTPTPSPAPTASPAPPAAAAPEPTPASADPQAEAAPPPTNEKPHRQHSPRPADQAPPASPDVGAPSPPTIVPVSQAAPPPATAPPRHQAAGPGDRYHVVRPGESLWSIAGDVLGDDASPARIAREVNGLWRRNSTRIATGDPDLLMVGTKLTLR